MTARQGVTQRQIYDMLMESQTWSPSVMESFQRSQLEQLLRHAKAQCAFYRDRLDPVFARDGQINWDRWRDLPLLRRKDVREHLPELRAAEVPQGHGHTADFRTSGSTSVPIQVRVSALMNTVNEAANQRKMSLHGIPAGQRFAFVRNEFLDGSH